MTYQHVLVAVDTRDEYSPLLTKAQRLAAGFGARLSVISVVLPVPVNTFSADMGMAIPMSVDPVWSEQLQQQTRNQLVTAAAALGIDDRNIHLVVGTADHAILETAKTLGADLIVLGHHRHQGFFSNLFAHTDESVVGKANCDVLAVYMAGTG